jgi:hypothetical protein
VQVIAKKSQSNRRVLKGWRPVVTLLVLAVVAPAQTVQPNPKDQTARANSASLSIKPYHSIEGRQRVKWFVGSTVGPETLTIGLFSAGFGTALDNPKEYGGSWVGYGKRYGMRLTGVSTGNAMEAGLGALWGEDPRYLRTYRQPLKGRLRSVVIMTFLAHGRDGQLVPAYARYMSTPGNNFLSNSWRPDSEANTRSALLRTVWGFVGLMGKNTFIEFWPDLQRHVFHGKH